MPSRMIRSLAPTARQVPLAMSITRFGTILLIYTALAGCGRSADISNGDVPSANLDHEIACLKSSPSMAYGDGLHAPSRWTIPLPASTEPRRTFPQCSDNQSFQFGSGKADITGPAGGKVFLGSETPTIYTRGIQLRQYARSFVIASPCNGKRVLITQADVGLMFESVRNAVLARINADPDLAGLYTSDNIMMNASHTHSGPGGQAHYNAYNFFRFGHDPEAFEITVAGIFRSIKQAHQDLAGHAINGPIRLNQGELLGANKSRARQAYLNNPESERRQYLDIDGNDVNTPRLMTLLKLQRDDGSEVGSLNWFGVHPTSDFFESTDYPGPGSGSPRPISGDNKGHASFLMERYFHQRSPGFVASFQQADEGDAFTHLWFDQPEERERRRAFLPPHEPSPLTVAMGNRQLLKALELYRDAKEPLVGAIDYRFAHVQMDAVEITDPVVLNSLQHPAELDTDPKRTCAPALGLSFLSGAAGAGPGETTEDGITAGGATCHDPNVDQLVEDTLAELGAGSFPTSLTAAAVGCNVSAVPGLNLQCQAEKPILFPIGPPINFTATTVPMQLFRIGNMAIIGLPWEFTTMAGRRLRQTLLDVLKQDGVDYIVINGLSNDYSSYVTTREEYAVQMYEGASTQFGPWTLAAVQQEARKLALDMVSGRISDPGPVPPTTFPTLVGVVPPQGTDQAPAGHSFGDVLVQPQAQYAPGDVVQVQFQASSPNSDVKTDGSFLFVERQQADGWVVVAQDADPETTFVWNSDSPSPQLLPTMTSTADVAWRIPRNTLPGTFRIRFSGVTNQASLLSNYEGVSNPFSVAGAGDTCP